MTGAVCSAYLAAVLVSAWVPVGIAAGTLLAHERARA